MKQSIIHIIEKAGNIFNPKNILFFIIATSLSCSTSKNTSTTRAYHNLTAHYNVYFNANENFKTGIRKLKKSEEDYARLLPIFRYEDLNTPNLVSSDMDMAITKCAKTIKSHSITAKPKMQAKGLSQKERDLLAKPEYCKWIDDAYLIMGKSHFYKREFETALQTFLLNINKYPKESSFDEANLWLAKTYAESKDYKNAESVLVELRKKKRWDTEFSREIELVYASMYLKQKDYNNAAQKLITVLAYKQKKKEKPRLQFILAQIYQNNNQYAPAIDYYKKVIKKNPNYDISFKSKINLAEIYEKNGANASELKGQFLKMLKDEKNIDYKDQLYYALAKIEQNQKNIDKAIEYYNLSARSKSSNKTQKVKTYYALADFYFSKENFRLAEAYYDSTAAVIEPTFPDYEIVNPQIISRKALSENLNIIYVEDSLQALAKLPENDRNRIIDNVIQNIRLQEEIAKNANQNNVYDPNLSNDYPDERNTNQETGASYYYYNQTRISFGKTEFKKKWGDRKLEDNWRRSNKQSVADISSDQDSTQNSLTDNGNPEEKKIKDNKTRDFYLQDIPLTPEKIAGSNIKIQKAYINSGSIYYKDFNERQKAINQYEKLLSRFPNTEFRQDILQKVHKLYLEDQNFAAAENYKQLIIKEFPNSMYAKMLTDPSYVQKVKKERDEIEKLYQTAYARYNIKEYTEAIGYCDHSLKTFPDNYLSPNFIFLKAMAYGSTGNKTSMRENLDLILKNYPDLEVAERSRAMIDIMEGRKFEEKLYLQSMDSIHSYVLVFPKEKIDLNKLKFKFISFNAKFFTQEDYKVIVQSFDDTKDMLLVMSFKNGKPALTYYQKIISEGLLLEYSNISPTHFIISSQNYPVYLKSKDDSKYLKFFEEEYLKN